MLDPIIAKWVRGKNLDEAESFLIKSDVVVSKIFTVEDIFNDPHFKARDMLPQVPDDELDTLVLPGVVPKLSLTPGFIVRTGGKNGRDTNQVLMDYTSLTKEEIFDLSKRGIIRQAPITKAGNILPS